MMHTCWVEEDGREGAMKGGWREKKRNKEREKPLATHCSTTVHRGVFGGVVHF